MSGACAYRRLRVSAPARIGACAYRRLRVSAPARIGDGAYRRRRGSWRVTMRLARHASYRGPMTRTIPTASCLLALMDCDGRGSRIPAVDGRLAIGVRYPLPGTSVPSVDSIATWGTLGPGRGTLEVNGASLRIERNGTFATFFRSPSVRIPLCASWRDADAIPALASSTWNAPAARPWRRPRAWVGSKARAPCARGGAG
jgi:hypothetical protein